MIGSDLSIRNIEGRQGRYNDMTRTKNLRGTDKVADVALDLQQPGLLYSTIGPKITKASRIQDNDSELEG